MEKVEFWVLNRKNVHVKNGSEWAFYVRIDNNDPWVVVTWDDKPNKKNIEFAKNLVMRAFKIYHSSIRFPSFDLESHPEIKVYE